MSFLPFTLNLQSSKGVFVSGSAIVRAIYTALAGPPLIEAGKTTSLMHRNEQLERLAFRGRTVERLGRSLSFTRSR
jgi:hypothetical protein